MMVFPLACHKTTDAPCAAKGYVPGRPAWNMSTYNEFNVILRFTKIRSARYCKLDTLTCGTAAIITAPGLTALRIPAEFKTAHCDFKTQMFVRWLPSSWHLLYDSLSILPPKAAISMCSLAAAPPAPSPPIHQATSTSRDTCHHSPDPFP